MASETPSSAASGSVPVDIDNLGSGPGSRSLLAHLERAALDYRFVCPHCHKQARYTLHLSESLTGTLSAYFSTPCCFLGTLKPSELLSKMNEQAPRTRTGRLSATGADDELGRTVLDLQREVEGLRTRMVSLADGHLALQKHTDQVNTDVTKDLDLVFNQLDLLAGNKNKFGGSITTKTEEMRKLKRAQEEEARKELLDRIDSLARDNVALETHVGSLQTTIMLIQGRLNEMDPAKGKSSPFFIPKPQFVMPSPNPKANSAADAAKTSSPIMKTSFANMASEAASFFAAPPRIPTAMQPLVPQKADKVQKINAKCVKTFPPHQSSPSCSHNRLIIKPKKTVPKIASPVAESATPAAPNCTSSSPKQSNTNTVASIPPNQTSPQPYTLNESVVGSSSSSTQPNSVSSSPSIATAPATTSTPVTSKAPEAPTAESAASVPIPRPVNGDGKRGPKRPLSAYMFYSMMVREKVKNDNPDATFGQIGKLIGEQWKALSDAEKQYYIGRSIDDLERFQRERKFYDLT